MYFLKHFLQNITSKPYPKKHILHVFERNMLYFGENYDIFSIACKYLPIYFLINIGYKCEIRGKQNAAN